MLDVQHSCKLEFLKLSYEYVSDIYQLSLYIESNIYEMYIKLDIRNIYKVSIYWFLGVDSLFMLGSLCC